MIWGKFYLPLVAGILLGAGTSAWAGNFTPPAEGPVAFRRDRVPLDAEAMAGLSRQLVTLAQGMDAETAANRRAAAQMLALSIAVDPGNARAREVISRLERERHRPNANPDQLEKSRSRIWQLLGWLETPEAGSQGQALAACLTDVIVVSDPKHPRAEALRGAGERGAWKGWIPGLAAYETPVVAETSTPDETTAATTGILLEKARVFTMLWKRPVRSEPKWVLGSAPVEMAAKVVTADGGSDPFKLIFGTPPNEALAPLAPPLLKLLEKQHGSLPAGGRVTISSPVLDESVLSKKKQSLSAAAAVLASAAISGREPDATIIGLVDESGAFTLPTGFWGQLQSLGPGTGGRVIMPAAAAEYLPSMLALERPQIFLEHEILLASNFQELVDLTAKSPGENLAKVSTQFREIREKAGSQPLGQYVANPFIRRRLADISLEAPYHYSAKMLAIQGAGNRPVFVPRKVLAAELRRAIEPMDWIVKLQSPTYESIQAERLGPTYETCRAEVDRLLRYADKDDRELVGRVEDMVATIRSLDRAAKGRTSVYDVSDPVTVAHAAFMRTYVVVAQELLGETDEAELVPAP